MVRKQYLEESIGQQRAASAMAPGFESEKIDRNSLEEEARNESLSSGNIGPEQRFWRRQRSWDETARVGVGIIRTTVPAGEKKRQ